MAQLRIFSYLPNPRIFKATIAARLCSVDVEVVGAKPRELGDWLWDFDARPLDEVSVTDKEAARRKARTGFSGDLYKTDAFVAAHPYGTVPAAFSPDGQIGVFESNSIMRAVARLGDPAAGLYGADPYSASRIDSFLDVSLVFARESQRYLLGLGGKRANLDLHRQAEEAFKTYLGGVEQALTNGPYIAGRALTLADICYACEYALFARDVVYRDQLAALGAEPITPSHTFQAARAHYETLIAHPAFQPDLGPYVDMVKDR